ncbi:MAG: hypothetical protein VB853_16285, partial [Pirellulales bacterium]
TRSAMPSAANLTAFALKPSGHCSTSAVHPMPFPLPSYALSYEHPSRKLSPHGTATTTRIGFDSEYRVSDRETTPASEILPDCMLKAAATTVR